MFIVFRVRKLVMNSVRKIVLQHVRACEDCAFPWCCQTCSLHVKEDVLARTQMGFIYETIRAQVFDHTSRGIMMSRQGRQK